jgi:hypothetical protein
MIMGLLIILVLQPATNVQAQATNGNWYVEPRTVMIPASADGTGQVQGKVMIDLRNGDIWGFATLSPLPYPVDANRREPPVVKPVYLGKFDLAAARRQ